MAKRKSNSLDARIERLYAVRCSGVQIDIMDIGKIFKVAQAAVTANPTINDAQLGDSIAGYVETIRRN